MRRDRAWLWRRRRQNWQRFQRELMVWLQCWQIQESGSSSSSSSCSLLDVTRAELTELGMDGMRDAARVKIGEERRGVLYASWRVRVAWRVRGAERARLQVMRSVADIEAERVQIHKARRL